MKGQSIFVYSLVLIFLMSSCGATNQMTIGVTEPAPVDLATSIRRIGVVNAVQEQSPSKLHNDGLEGIVEAQDNRLNKKGRKAALMGLITELKKDDRFKTVNLVDSVSQNESNLTKLNDSIAWDKVAAICEKNSVDALFALASYETETQISSKKSKMMQSDMMRVSTKVPAKEITLETLIENGWRIYDPKQRVILDEFSFNTEIVSRAKGSTEIEALRAVGNRRDSVLVLGQRAGISYGKRLLPFEKEIYREYYVKGTKRFESAKELVLSADMKGATQLWHLELDNTKEKLRGRACHNIAVGLELEGKLEEAIDWAKKADSYLNHKGSHEYLQALAYRLDQQLVLKGQLKKTYSK